MNRISISKNEIIKNYENLDEIKKNISHNESNLYLKDNKIYKIYKKGFINYRLDTFLILENINLEFANNIIDTLYDDNKLFGSTTKYLENFITLDNCKDKLSLYEIKIIMEKIIYFFKEIQKYNLNYWDIHLNNMGLNNNEFYIMDIDSMKFRPHTLDIQFAYNHILELFYEMALNNNIRKNYLDPKEVFWKITENIYYLNYELLLSDIAKIIQRTSENEIEEKKMILKKFNH